MPKFTRLAIIGCLAFLLSCSLSIAYGQNGKGASGGESSKESRQLADTTTATRKPDSPEPLAPAHYSAGFFTVGAVLNDLDQSAARLAEYEALRQGIRPTARFAHWGSQNGIAWDLSAERGQDPNDQRYSLKLDARRYFQSELEIDRFLHRLENDQRTNLDAAKGSIVVRHDNQDTNINYCPYYQELRSRNRMTLPFLSMVTVHLNYRQEWRKGTTQIAAISKCANCHITTKVKPLDESTRDIEAGIEISLKPVRGHVSYTFLNRDYQERGAILQHTYDRAIHPVTGVDMFVNRVSYDSTTGPLPITDQSRSKKNSHLLKARFELPGQGELSGTYVNSYINNHNTGFGADSKVVSGRYSGFLGNRFRFSAQIRNLDINSDSYFVDLNEPVATGGPQVGKTFSQVYPAFGPVDYLKRSSLEREDFTASLDASLLLKRKSVARFGYRYEDLERPNFEARETKTHRVRMSFDSTPAKELKGRMSYTYTKADAPFTHFHAALSPVMQPSPSPGASPLGGLQYFAMYNARQAHLSNAFSSAHDATISATWTPSQRAGMTAHTKLSKEKNNQLNYSSWYDREFTQSAEMWIKPADRVDLTASYSWHQRRTTTLFIMPVFDG